MAAGRGKLAIVAVALLPALVLLDACSSPGKSSAIPSTSANQPPAQPATSPALAWRISYSLPIGASGQATDVFNGISCADSLHCQAIGGTAQNQFMLGTSDGGANWVQEQDPSFLSSSAQSGGSPPGVTAIDCPTALQCYALTQHQYSYTQGNSSSSGLGAAIIGTTNAGATWSLQATIVNTEYFNAISCPSSSVCFASGSGFIADTTNAGANWSRLSTVPSNLPDLLGISCPTTTTCVTLGGSTIFTTTDAGHTWSRATPPAGVVGLSALSCLQISTCYAIGGLGTSSQGVTSTSGSVVIKSTDGGVKWTTGKTLGDDNPIRITCPLASSCYIVGYGSTPNGSYGNQGGSSALVLFSSNGGASWTQQTTPTQVNGLQDISCANAGKCWAIGGATPNGAMQAGNFTSGYIIAR